ncbi:uncharacterized protein PAE49_024216 isoform 2-T2 [Odontesthes bonariensis]|uniref:uncharacterized protein LOC142372436 isoform X2 n=1 Tax=Odontesthes bonariensis TaxID=219752 RepID=UPI003F58B0BA
MNLYRSFGNLMEAWVNESKTCSEPDWLGNNTEDPVTSSADIGTNPRSESVDSGVETDTLCPATSCSVSPNNTEMDLFNEGLTPGSQSPFPSFSETPSSSPRLCPSRADEGSAAFHLKVEKALQRADSKHLKRVDELRSQQPQESFPSKQHTPESVRCQRSESFCLRRTVNPSAPVRHSSEKHRRPLSVGCVKQRSEGLGMEDRKELSPGLCYLEQVCQMLEDIARQQMHNQVLQEETETLEQQQDTQVSHVMSLQKVPETCQSDSGAIDMDPSICNKHENAENTESISSKPQQQKSQHFRQRSVSDTTSTTLHLRKLNANCRGQHLSTNDLLERVEEDDKMQDESTKTKKNWKLKFASLRRGETAVSDTKCRCSHLRKTQPADG